jgi:hypothetical protein
LLTAIVVPGLALDRVVLPSCFEQVGSPEREAVDDDGAIRLHRGERTTEIECLLDRRPPRRPLGPVATDTLGHLLVERSRGRDQRRRLAGEPLSQLRLAASRAAEQHHQRHDRTGTTAPSITRTRAP